MNLVQKVITLLHYIQIEYDYSYETCYTNTKVDTFTLLVKKQQMNEADEATNRHPISSACLIMISQLYASMFTDT